MRFDPTPKNRSAFSHLENEEAPIGQEVPLRLG